MANYKINTFTTSIDKWIDASGSGITDCIEIMAGKVQEDLVNRSPVDTGRFRGNWQVTADRPAMHALNNYDREGADTIAEGKRAVYAMLRGGGAVKQIWFSNMLIYANALEYGHSKQAPAGVAGVVAVRLRSYLADAIKEARAKNAL